MPRYTITLAQQVLETTTITVEATSPLLAERQALEKARTERLEWEPEAVEDVYVLQIAQETSND